MHLGSDSSRYHLSRFANHGFHTSSGMVTSLSWCLVSYISEASGALQESRRMTWPSAWQMPTRCTTVGTVLMRSITMAFWGCTCWIMPAGLRSNTLSGCWIACCSVLRADLRQVLISVCVSDILKPFVALVGWPLPEAAALEERQPCCVIHVIILFAAGRNGVPDGALYCNVVADNQPTVQAYIDGIL